MTDDAVTDLTRGVYRRIYGGFTKGQRINKLSLQAEAWFWRVVATVDDFGNGDADPQLCRDATAGHRKAVTKAQVGKWLDEMAAAGLIEFYWAKGDKLLHVKGFLERQPAGKNGKRLKRYMTPEEARVNPGESKIAQENPDASSASDNDNENHTEDEDETKKDMSIAAQARRVFGFWQEHLKHPKAVFDDKRARVIKNRLKDGYSEEDLIRAIRGCKLTPYNMGKNSEHRVYDDIELICRDAAHVDRFIEAAPNANGKPPPKKETDTERELRESCPRCFGTGTERVPGKGARTCKHERLNDGSVYANSKSVEGSSQDRAEGVP